jgi:hypothetical protein
MRATASTPKDVETGLCIEDEVYRDGGRALADELRQILPDLDDFTIGRVALALGEYAGKYTGRVAPNDHNMLALSNSLVLAGLDLTAIEWRNPR